ncbi:hypothetical protein ACM16X_16735 [Haloarcula japonica]|uniref:hypothetical protein n=1 Tax=Haloarcula japonica TaxID=29282 RepID=UPI0039F6EC9B
MVGGGPAGATAAAELGSRGRSVFHVDKATFPREKLCGGLVTWKTAKLLDRVFDIDPDSLAESAFINDTTGDYNVRFTGSTARRGKSRQPFHFADRRAYDATLFNAAGQYDSVTQRDGTAVTDVFTSTVKISLSQSPRTSLNEKSLSANLAKDELPSMNCSIHSTLCSKRSLLTVRLGGMTVLRKNRIR